MASGGAWDLLRALRALVVRLPDLADREDVRQQLSAAAQDPQRVSDRRRRASRRRRRAPAAAATSFSPHRDG
jgi:hypothetical protein